VTSVAHLLLGVVTRSQEDVQHVLLVIALLELVYAMSTSSVERFVRMRKVHVTTLLGCAAAAFKATFSIVYQCARKLFNVMLIVAPDQMTVIH